MKMMFRCIVLSILITLQVCEISCGHIAPGAVVDKDATLIGDVTIGAGTVVRPRAGIIAHGGPIFIGEGTMIHENALITNKINGNTLFIGNGNIFHVGSTCEAYRVGNGNILQSNSYVGSAVEITNGCMIQTGCRFTKPGMIPQGSMIAGDQCH